MQCRDCQALVLDAAYGLLDAVQAAALLAHAEACAECDAAVRDVRRMQGLFAAAAKMTFPNVKFEAPRNAAAAAVKAPRKTRSFTPWAIAASVMVVAMAGVAALQQDRGTEPVAKVDAPKNEGTTGRGLGEGSMTPPPVVQKDHNWTVSAPGDPPAYVVKITGSTALTLGVPNEYSILATDLVNRKAVVTLTVRLRNANEDVLFEKVFKGGIVSLPVKDAEAKWLQVTAVDALGVATEWKTKLPVVASK